MTLEDRVTSLEQTVDKLGKTLEVLSTALESRFMDEAHWQRVREAVAASKRQEDMEHAQRRAARSV